MDNSETIDILPEGDETIDIIPEDPEGFSMESEEQIHLDNTTINVEPIDGGYLITINDGNGIKKVAVMNGVKGDKGERGNDGFSPVVTTTVIPDGHRVSITDATGEHEFDVIDGETPVIDCYTRDETDEKFVHKDISAVKGNIPVFNEDGDLVDGNKSFRDIMPENINNEALVSAKLLTQDQYDTLIADGEIQITDVDPVTGETTVRTVNYDPETIYDIYEEE